MPSAVTFFFFTLERMSGLTSGVITSTYSFCFNPKRSVVLLRCGMLSCACYVLQPCVVGCLRRLPVRTCATPSPSYQYWLYLCALKRVASATMCGMNMQCTWTRTHHVRLALVAAEAASRLQPAPFRKITGL